MNIADAYPKRKSGTAVYGYNNALSSIAVAHESNEFSSSYDYVMVFPMGGENHDEQTTYAKYCIHQVMEAGLEVFTYLSVQYDELLVLIRCPLEKLKDFADKINYDMKIDPAHLELVLTSGNPEYRINPIHIRHDPAITPYTPYEHIYLEYGRRHDQRLYYVPHGSQDPWVKSIRLKLIALMLRSPKRDGGCGLEISNLIFKKRMLAFFPLHDRETATAINNKVWDKSIWPWSVPVEDIREYFGEKIALYFVFIGHYSLWLFTPSLIGLAFQLVVWGTLNFSHPVLPFYSLVVTVWSVYMLEYWKRQQATTALMWGMSEFEAEEQDRPEFFGETIKSYINGKDITYFPSSKAAKRATISQSVVLTFVTIVVGIVAAIYTFRFYLQSRSDTASSSSFIASILNTVQIQILNFIYQRIARKLTDMENHRVDTAYEDSLIVKLFLFQFINSYASFFFLAFIAGNLQPPNDAPDNYLGQCGASNCMEPLSINLAVIFGLRLTLGNFTDVFIPYFFHKQKIKNETKGIAEDKFVTPPEKDYMLLNFEPMIESIQNYADTAIQYGFGLLFITALPCASFCSLLSCYFKVKFNTWKITTFFQRSVPEGAQDIGTWLTIFQVISVASVVTNAGLICFTMDVLWDYSLQGRVWVFIGFQWVLIALQFVTQAVVPDVPEEVEIQIARNEFIKSKVVDKVEDEDFGEPEEVEEDDGDDEETKKRGGCCKFPSTRKKTKVKNLEHEYPVSAYPIDGNATSWPKPLASDPNASGAKASAKKPDGPKFESFAGAAAVPDTPNKDDGMTRNPAATYY